ncbi:MAG: shikimate dehydrogenase [Oscillospiraceae bacterium]|nr:shikimate dehydrogenase [Oscillospiraceae bacterium]
MQIEYRNDTKLLAVIGDPIAHSLSPLLHNTMAKAMGMNYLYLACHVTPDMLPSWLAAVKTLDIAGFNATMPHKLALIPKMGVLTNAAKRNGAVNSVRNNGGLLIGHNTDGAGFARCLRDHGLAFSGARVTVLGAGGAAGAIVRRAADDGAARVCVMNRTPDKARMLCAEDPARLRAMALSEPIPPDTDLLINTLPVQARLPDGCLDGLRRDCAVFDILYAPPITALMQQAKARGMRAENGLGMLIYQAIYAFEFFTGAEIDDAAMALRLRRAVEER